MKKLMLIAVVFGLFGLTSCENAGINSANGAKNAVSLLDKVIGQEYAFARKTVERFGIPFWEQDGDEYVFDGDGNNDLVRLFVSNGVVYKATYELTHEPNNVASCDNIITTWANKLNNHKIGGNNVVFSFATGYDGSTLYKTDDFSQLSNSIKNLTYCNIDFNVGDQYTIGHIYIKKGYEDSGFYWSDLIYEWNK